MKKLDPKLAKLLSSFFLDIAKAWFVASFVPPILKADFSFLEFIGNLTVSLIVVILYLSISYWLLNKGEQR